MLQRLPVGVAGAASGSGAAVLGRGAGGAATVTPSRSIVIFVPFLVVITLFTAPFDPSGSTELSIAVRMAPTISGTMKLNPNQTMKAPAAQAIMTFFEKRGSLT